MLCHYQNFHRGAFVVFSVLALLLLTSCTELIRQNHKIDLKTLEGGSYRLDSSHSTLLFKVDHFGLSTYVGRFNKISATLEFDPDNIQETSLMAIVETSSIDVNNPEFSETLTGEDWFDSQNFPQAVYETQGVKSINGNNIVYEGTLTMLGKVVPVDLQVHFRGGANNMLTGYYTIGFSAKSVLKRSDFGLDRYLGLVGDEVALEVFAEFVR
ncbi:polyisoprenoid-binding protein [Pseudomaricurvus alkylphenolicus]|jgi:polyisoprenoid-binding protein YceI|uniref:YceI family protein n=1 Tax=Pseudomaricurvus alkylphenolicus TaxID=1306991 RepID=UPI0014228776|nr:YceI family protein [Pseudomaricurvus alkylphenolicus]NIB41096.1 polyisoprenoid-binding protein [Pseudomaricurvus alkylphenolicus]